MRNKSSICGSITCPILIGVKVKNHRAQYAVSRSERWGLVNILF